MLYWWLIGKCTWTEIDHCNLSNIPRYSFMIKWSYVVIKPNQTNQSIIVCPHFYKLSLFNKIIKANWLTYLLKSHQLQGCFAPSTPTRGFAPGPEWWHIPQTPIIGSRSRSSWIRPSPTVSIRNWLCLPYMHKFSAEIIGVYSIDLLVLLMHKMSMQ